MADVRGLSDEELHSRLCAIGITTPVTATTRKILMKKLIQDKKKPRRVVSVFNLVILLLNLLAN